MRGHPVGWVFGKCLFPSCFKTAWGGHGVSAMSQLYREVGQGVMKEEPCALCINVLVACLPAAFSRAL